MTALNLPDPIAAYFAADPRSADATGQILATHAVVKDEGHTYTGLDAIQAWRVSTSAAYTFASRPYKMEETDGFQVVTSRVTGNFPGSPLDLKYRFRIEHHLISSLEITA